MTRLVLVVAEGEADDVDIVFFVGAEHGRTPAAADVEQRHARLQVAFAEREVDLGPLRLLERHVLALEVGAAVGHARIEEQQKEVVGQVVVGLHLREEGLELRHSSS